MHSPFPSTNTVPHLLLGQNLIGGTGFHCGRGLLHHWVKSNVVVVILDNLQEIRQDAHFGEGLAVQRGESSKGEGCIGEEGGKEKTQ